MITFGSDIGEMILQRTLSSNTLGLQNAIERMTSGYKVNHAKDNAAGYSIITDLNTQISSMLQVQQNTEDGISMLQIAGGGLEEIQSLLERLRSLATQASNGNYGSDERASMQAEADAIIAEESSAYVKYQILQQASTTLIAASRNIRSENVLGLLSNLG